MLSPILLLKKSYTTYFYQLLLTHRCGSASPFNASLIMLAGAVQLHRPILRQRGATKRLLSQL